MCRFDYVSGSIRAMSTEAVNWSERLDWTFGDRIRKIRRAVNVSQGEFADAIGRTRESLSTWESGRIDAPRDVVAIAKRIELAYGVPASWTLGLETKNAPGPGGPGASARSEGFEPPTFWSGVSGPAEQHSGDVVELFPQHLHEEVAA